ncbi:putative pregnancy-associated plasma protein-A [Lyophyllum shimeji]|uniref:Pregnancy-associated plasma protein-A n=1 Tax=Lyophyllum shimeji TaxID=47721 RepID=A0A9P3PW01_LYOSH|nr:putative pregnancy-associated plasma protein-A [Lyophyllum shimeji]
MFVSLAFTLLLGATAALASPHNVTRRVCGTVTSDADVLRMEQDFQAKKVAVSDVKTPVTIPVLFHVVSKDSTAIGGNIPDSQIAEQIVVMNKAYGNASITWVLAGTTRTVNAVWFNTAGPDTSAQTAMKKALRQGGANVLQRLYCRLQFRNPKDDGVVILFSSVPGGTAVPYNFGQTLTHEAGHWVGLFHTFQGGCSGAGDQVDDTPSEASPAFGCPNGRDTCSSAGVDPIHNYMDYTDDVCMTEFTAGQVARLKTQIATYRGITV